MTSEKSVVDFPPPGFRRQSSGVTLVEIILAIFILSVGILSVASLFPVGIRCARGVTDNTQATLTAESALSALQSYMSYYTSSGAIEYPSDGVNNPVSVMTTRTTDTTLSTPSTQLTCEDLEGNAPWGSLPSDHWSGYFAVLRSGSMQGKWFRISGSGSDYLTVDVTSDDNGRTISAGTPLYISRGPRVHYISTIVNSTTFTTKDTLSGSLDYSWEDDFWNGYYLLFLTGELKGRFYPITDTTSGRNLVLSGVDLQQDGARVNDLVEIIGNNNQDEDGGSLAPCWLTASQTAVTSGSALDYTFAFVLDHADEFLTGVYWTYLFVYKNYDNSLQPWQNERPLLFYKMSLSRW